MNKKRIAHLDEYKRLIKSVIGKDKDLTLKDFEKFVKAYYNVAIYNSITELYKEVYHMDISEEIDQYVDDLAMPIVETTHKVFRYVNHKIKDKDVNATKVFYSYKGNNIIDMFIERSGILENGLCLFLFIKEEESITPKKNR